MPENNPEQQRLDEDAARTHNWKRWGPYLSERQWGTVREDYSPDGDCWRYFPHDHARSRAYRWGEDGLLGWCDRECRLCFSLALWNGRDPILKERLFGLTNAEGNHGEDVKEEYYYLDSTPTHSYAKALYKYPQAEFPYDQLVQENARRTRRDREYELSDTGVLAENRYFDVVVEYAKAAPDDTLIRITARNLGPIAAILHLVPQLFFRNTWAWGCEHEGCEVKPRLRLAHPNAVACEHATLGRFLFHVEPRDNIPTRWLFTENETNLAGLFHAENYYPYVRDAFHNVIVHQRGAVNPANVGTKCAAYFGLEIAPSATVQLKLRLHPDGENPPAIFGPQFDETFRKRIAEADAFYRQHIPLELNDDKRLVLRQAWAGLLWSKQFYHYAVREWLTGDPTEPRPPESRWHGRNSNWPLLFNRDVILMPDKWEYPWYATWDLAFHLVTVCRVDPLLAKQQAILFLREWYMHPQGKLPAYEFNFDDVNPPVLAWACWRIYKITGARGHRDVPFLERVFHKLLINFTWWVNRKDLTGRNIFGGGFLGLDNIGIFDRSRPLPGGQQLEQADGTAWMAFYCGTMLAIALELASVNPVYEDVASKFFEHFIAIVDAINTLGGMGLWDDEDGFYYDRILIDGRCKTIKLRSMVGLIPLFAVEILEDSTLDGLPGFRKRMGWFLRHRADLARFISYLDRGPHAGRRLLAVPSRRKLERMLARVFDEKEFLSPFGLRSLSRVHLDHPLELNVNGRTLTAHYAPAESDSDLFGGNSNWRGPIWFPLNYLFIESLERYHHFYADDFKIEYPTGSGRTLNLQQIAADLSRRLSSLFLRDSTGRRPASGDDQRYADDPHHRDLVLFHEYFDGDNGRGLGASHQTGWTALVTHLMG